MSSTCVHDRITRFEQIASFFTEEDRPCAQCTWQHLLALMQQCAEDRMEFKDGVLLTCSFSEKDKVSLTLPVRCFLRCCRPSEVLALSYPNSPFARTLEANSVAVRCWLRLMEIHFSARAYPVKNIVLVLNLFAKA